MVVQTFKNPKPALMAALRESGPVPGDENGLKSKRTAAAEEGSKKKKRVDKNVSSYKRENIVRVKDKLLTCCL
jgi:hypothetical protein